MSDVFISHVEEDSDVALELALRLEEAGYRTWSYEIDSMPGPSYLIQTGRAIEQSQAVVLIISKRSLSSNQLTREVVRAHESGKHFVPVLRDVSHAEFQSRQPEWREAIGAATSIRIPQEGVAAILARLIDGLKALGVHPRSKPDTTRMSVIRKSLAELSSPAFPGQVKQQVPSAEIAKKPKKWRTLGTTPIAIILIVVVAIIMVLGSFFMKGGFNLPGLSLVILILMIWRWKQIKSMASTLTSAAVKALKQRGKCFRLTLITFVSLAVLVPIVLLVILPGIGDGKPSPSATPTPTSTSTATPAITPKTTPTPSITPQQFVFAPDDFNDGTISPSWGLTTAMGLYFREDGVLTLEGNQNGASTTGAYFLSTASPRQDVTVMIDFRAPTGIQINNMCMFRVQFDAFNYFEVGIYKQGYALTRCMGPQVDAISTFLPLFGDETTKFHTLKLSYKDDSGHIDAFINDIQVYAIDDKQFSASFTDFRFAFYVFSVEGQYIEREWDNFASSGFTPAATPKSDELVTFADLNLEIAIRYATGKMTGGIRQSDLWGITELKATNQNIGNLTGLEYCTNITILDLGYNQITDISPLSHLNNLTILKLGDNQISDLSPLSTLTNLTELNVWVNRVVDLSAVSNLTNLTHVELHQNEIENISPLSKLTNLEYLHIWGNKISDITPLSNLSGITDLAINQNKISDISAISKLAKLSRLDAAGNSFSDVTPLSSLTNLNYLDLNANQITDISSLISNDGLGNGDVVHLRDNPLSANSVNLYIPQLKQKGVAVWSN